MSKYDEERKKIQKYLTEVIGKIILILLYFIASTAVLYGCKVAASGTIPTNGDYYPFTNLTSDAIGPEPVDGEKVSNIFTTIFLDHNRSEKISFTNDDTRKENKGSWMIDLVRRFAEIIPDTTSGNEKKENVASGNEKKENVTCFNKYIWNVFGRLLSFDYKMLVGVLKYMNNLWEWVIVAGGPIIMIFVLFGLVILNLGYFSFLWFANMVLFFEYNDCQECTPPPPCTPSPKELTNRLVDASPAGQALKEASNLPFIKGGDSGDSQNKKPDLDVCVVPTTPSAAVISGLYITFLLVVSTVVFFMGFFTGVTLILQIFIIVSIFLSIVTFVSKIDVSNNGNGGIDGSFKVVMWRLFRFYKVIITVVIVYMMIKLAWKDLSGPAAYGAFAAAGLIFLFNFVTLFKRRDIPSMTPIIEKPVKTEIIPIIPTDDSSSSEQRGGGSRKGCSTIYPTKDVNQLIKNIKKVSKRMKAM